MWPWEAMSMVEKKTRDPLLSYQKSEEKEMARTIAETLYRYDQIAEDRIERITDLTEDHVRMFWERGYLVVEQAINEDEIRNGIEALMDAVMKRTEGPRVQIVRPETELVTDEDRERAARKVFDFIDHEPRLRAIAMHPDVLAAMEKLLGEKAKVVQDQAILKPPGGGAEKPWHQDMAYGPLAFNRSVIGAWFALDPADLDNGCMHVIPYSHMDGAVPHYAERDWQLCDRTVNVAKDVAVPLKPGGVLLFSGLLHHGTPPNFSEKRRRAVQIHYAPDSAVKLNPQEYKRMFTNEMTGAEC
jgi:phytanoyl-CoA hydroxylase